MSVVSIHQPAYLPWLGYFHKLMLSDVFVVLDNTQFEKNSFINRNKIRTGQGWTWLTIPLLTKGHFERTIADMEWDPAARWQRKHSESIRQAYGRAPFFDTYYPPLQAFLDGATRFSTLLVDMLRYFAAEVGADTRIVCASDLGVDGRKSDLILNICTALDARTYVSGSLGANYLDRAAFERAGLEIVVQQYRHPEYQQQHEPFEPFMAIIDCLMNHGGARTAELIVEGNLTPARVTR